METETKAETKAEKGTILKLVELLENAGFRVLGAHYNNNDILEPIIVSIGNGLTKNF